MLFHTVLLLSFILLATSCKVDNKAASSSLNIDCQCSSLVWEDSNRSVLLLSSILLAVNCTVDNKAGSPSLNSDCQCSSLIWEEGYCISPDHNGARECYVDLVHNSCQDLVPSARFPLLQLLAL